MKKRLTPWKITLTAISLYLVVFFIIPLSARAVNSLYRDYRISHARNVFEEIYYRQYYGQQIDAFRILYYDVRFPQGYDYPNDNELFSLFQESFIKNRKRAGYDPAYIAVRECSREKHQHYHVVLMMDGHKTQSPHDHIQTAERLWEKTLNLPPKCDHTGRATSYGLIDDCMRNRQGQPQENGVMLRKDDPEYERKYDQCFRRCSYLAKVNQKDASPKHQRELFSSRIQK